jgi:hypothetical protein
MPCKQTSKKKEDCEGSIARKRESKREKMRKSFCLSPRGWEEKDAKE